VSDRQPCLDDLYRRHVFSRSVIESVIEKENSLGYPLDRLNDMRALINFGPYYLQDWVARAAEMETVVYDAELMSITRLLRMHMGVLATLAAMRRLARNDSDLDLVDRGSKVAKIMGSALLRRLDGHPHSEDMSGKWNLTSPVPVNPDAMRIGRSVSWKILEMADRMGMGEHVIYSHMPVLTEYRTVRKAFFFQRRHHCFPHRVVIGDGLNDDSKYAPDVSLFRGRPMTPLPSADRAFMEVVVDGTSLTDAGRLTALDERLSVALGRICAQEEAMESRTDLEIRKMIRYSVEVREIDRAAGKVWRLPDGAHSSIRQREISTQLGMNDERGYAEGFFKLIKEGLAWLQRT